MPRTDGPPRISSWSGVGDAWILITELVTAIGVWGAIGWGLDRWLGTDPVLLAIGMVVGCAAGIYIIWHRAQRQAESARGSRSIKSDER